tara:strand:- start:1847 stop:1990 length:144 start_codon:yes stop_codon:yes gene_type:complete
MKSYNYDDSSIWVKTVNNCNIIVRSLGDSILNGKMLEVLTNLEESQF